MTAASDVEPESMNAKSVYHTYEDSIRRHLEEIQDIKAIYISENEKAVVHVFSVVSEYRSATYEELLEKEWLIEKELPESHLNFTSAPTRAGSRPERSPLDRRPYLSDDLSDQGKPSHARPHAPQDCNLRLLFFLV